MKNQETNLLPLDPHGILLDLDLTMIIVDLNLWKVDQVKLLDLLGLPDLNLLKGTVPSCLMSKRKAEGKMNFGDLVSTAMKSRYKTVEEAGYVKK